MNVSIEYHPMADMDRMKYPDVATGVFCPDDWTDAEIRSWYENRHRHLHHDGINVVKISRN